MSCRQSAPAGAAGPGTGDRLPSLTQLAAIAAFTQVTVTRYSKTATIGAAAVTCLWHSVFGTCPVTVVLIRDRAKTGHDPADVEHHRARAPGTSPRPSHRPPTWPPSSAGSSSPQDFRHLALTSQPLKKSTSSAWPGKTSPHNHESRDVTLFQSHTISLCGTYTSSAIAVQYAHYLQHAGLQLWLCIPASACDDRGSRDHLSALQRGNHGTRSRTRAEHG